MFVYFWLGLKAHFEPIFGAHSLDPMQGPIKALFCVILESICRAHFSLCPAQTQKAINRPLGPAETRPCTVFFPWHKAPFHACRPRRACPFNIVFYLHVHGSSPWQPNLQRSIMSPMQPLQAPVFFASTPRPTLAQMLAFTSTLNNRPRTRRSLPLLASNGPCFAPAYLRSYSAALNTNYQLLLRAFWRQDHLLTKHHRLSGSSSCAFTAPCKSRQVGCPSLNGWHLQQHGTRPFVEVARSTVPGKVGMPLPFPMQRSSTPKL